MDMPLKPVYKRAPLLTLQQSALIRGAVSTNDANVKMIYECCKKYPDEVTLLEGTFGLSCLLCADPLQEPAAIRIRELVKTVVSDSPVQMSEKDQVAVMRAAFALYEYSGEKELAASILAWCARKEAEWDQLIADAGVRQLPADLMELLVSLYRRTGSKGLLRLCTRLRSQSMDWTSIIRTFDQNRGLKKLIDHNELCSAIEKENNDETAYYTRLYLTNNAVNFADGIRYTVFSGQFSGNGQEMSAGERGWDLIRKYHYAVCGGSTADRTLEGMGTHRAIDAASTAAWCEALCNLYLANSKASLLQDIMDIAVNAIPALIGEEGPAEYQFVNIVKEDSGISRVYDPADENVHRVEILARLSRALDLLYRTAVSVTESGAAVNMMLPCTVKFTLSGKTCGLESDGETVRLKIRESIKAGIFFAASADTDVRLNDDSAFRVVKGSRVLFDRIWAPGDRIVTETAEDVKTVEGHHHSAVIRKGNTVYALPASEKKFAYALCGEATEREGKIYGRFRKVKDWKQAGGIPNNVPVYPQTEGSVTEMELVPYADVKTRITVFPRGQADS